MALVGPEQDLERLDAASVNSRYHPREAWNHSTRIPCVCASGILRRSSALETA